MEHTHVFIDILVVLLAAKLAGELAERIQLPAVVGEIIAGVIIGPSAFGLVSGNDTLTVFGELGVILLLFSVGLEMELTELLAVGRSSLLVASTGVIVPFAGGTAAGLALGFGRTEAIFVGAALTATSVGITARVFGDLRALSTTEARTVLGAAVADDVIGLVILTVVVGIVTKGTVSVWYVAGIVLLATGFLVVASLVGRKVTPQLFTLVTRYSRSSGTLVAVALSFTLGIASLAQAAKLAPIIGAFVAGIALRESHVAERVRRELTPVGHLFIPVFFLQIGINADVKQFAQLTVLRDAGVLLVVAVVGKLASALVVGPNGGDKLLIGIGMIPRGEVGLIFATIGLQEAVYGNNVYAALLLVVLVSTVVTPPLLRLRLKSQRARRIASHAEVTRSVASWLQVEAAPRRPTVTLIELVDIPPAELALPLALEAAWLGMRHRPGPKLLDWLGRLPDDPLVWDRSARTKFFHLLEHGGPRSWRFLAVTGILERALPELAVGVSRRQSDLSDLDPIGVFEWPRLARLRELRGYSDLSHPERAALAALIIDACDEIDTLPTARKLLQRLGVGSGTEEAVAQLVGDLALLPAAARRIDLLGEESVMQLASHLRTSEQALALFLLAQATADLEGWELTRLEDLHELIQGALSDEITGPDASSIVDSRRAEAVRRVDNAALVDRIMAAPRVYVMSTSVDDLVRHAWMCEPRLQADEARVTVIALADHEWRIDFAARDRVGLLARETAVFGELGYDVRDALAVTWDDQSAVASFRAVAHDVPIAENLKQLLEDRLDQPEPIRALPSAELIFDDHASPWHTLCRAYCPDEVGVLRAITSVFAACGVSVHAARITSDAGVAVDVFELTDRNGDKLTPATENLIERVLRTAKVPQKRRVWQRRRRSDEPRRSQGDEPSAGTGVVEFADREDSALESDLVQGPLTSRRPS